MARKRMIDLGIWDSEQAMSLTPRQFKIYLFAISQADDEGRLKISVSLWKTRIFPFDEITEADILSDIYAMHHAGLIQMYENTDSVYLFHPNWYKYQRISHATPSKLPSPEDSRLIQINPEDSGQIRLVSLDQSRLDKDRLTTSAKPADNEVVDKYIEQLEREREQDPEIPDDKIPERYQVVQDILKSEYGSRICLSHLVLLEQLFKNSYPNTVYMQLKRVKQKALDGKKDPPSNPIEYIHSYMKNWTKKMTKQEQNAKKSPPRKQLTYYCPICESKLEKLDDGTYGCHKCKEYYVAKGDKQLEKVDFDMDVKFDVLDVKANQSISDG